MLVNTEKMRYWVHHILPLVYDDSLSYYEVLAKVVKKLNEVIENDEAQNEVIVALQNQVGTYTSRIETLESFANTIADTIEDVLKEYSGYGENKVLSVENDELVWIDNTAVPSGGVNGQVLTKVSGGSSWEDAPKELPSVVGGDGQVLTSEDGVVKWKNVPNEVPSDGAVGDVLTRNSDGFGWEGINRVPDGGIINQVLVKQSGADGDTAWASISGTGGDVPAGGLTGQVLVKQSGADYDVDWEDSGDNVAYPDLRDKPSLNGVTIVGSKGSEDYKLQDEIEKVVITTPTSATTGTLTDSQFAVITANYENYVVLNDEIYKLADDQTDSGYLVYSHTGEDSTHNFFIKCFTVTLSTKGWVLTTKDLQEVKYSNRNLLDNSWFTVNQRGKTTYPGNAYSVDRWTGNTSGITVTPQTNYGVKIHSTNAGVFIQKIDETVFSGLAGKTVTFSCKLSSNSSVASGDGIRFNVNGNNLGTVYFNSASPGAVVSSTITLPSAITSMQVNFIVSSSADFTIECCKLETGSVATLANDAVPNYVEELAKCQRYFYIIKGNGNRLGFGQQENLLVSPSRIFVVTPVAMHTLPTIAVNDINNIFVTGEKGYANFLDLTVARMSGETIELHGNLSAQVSNATYGMFSCITNGDNVYVSFSAEL